MVGAHVFIVVNNRHQMSRRCLFQWDREAAWRQYNLDVPWSWNVQLAFVAIKNGALALKTLESQQGGKLGTLWSFHNGRAQRV